MQRHVVQVGKHEVSTDAGGKPFVTDARLAGDVLAEVARLEAEAADAAAALIARL